MKKDAIFKKQRVRKVPIHLRDRIQKLIDVLKKYDILSPVNKEQQSTGNTFTNPKPSDYFKKGRITKNRLICTIPE